MYKPTLKCGDFLDDWLMAWFLFETIHRPAATKLHPCLQKGWSQVWSIYPICNPWCWYLKTYKTRWFCSGKCYSKYSSTMEHLGMEIALTWEWWVVLEAADFFVEILGERIELHSLWAVRLVGAIVLLNRAGNHKCNRFKCWGALTSCLLFGCPGGRFLWVNISQTGAATIRHS